MIREWRVRPWIKAAAAAGFAGMCAIQAWILVNGPADEVTDGWIALGGYLVLAYLLVVRPRVRVDGEDVEIRNPLRTWRFRRADVTGWHFHGFGLAFALADGRRPWSIVFQATLVFSDAPRWADAVEAVTGERPDLPEHEDDEDEDDEDDGWA